ncbi:hypothetical protein JD844_012463 [Phrynosoma platyrhinos]|uniref:Ubiquitin-activating enzyme E1 C-terminal domain-containing protein n=1 Tax=Phrynosoma platyrhinos TaxID=52577 RepID=A0ABQ7TKD4_PHRPL|nr:hypothetical protein JD844_012463 [Phrynosoma platyrhinos]
MSASESLPEIDEGLYSRQLYVLGREAMQKMARADVLVSGMKGLGVEIAKNIILAGCCCVFLQFYLSESDVGKNRAVVSQRHLKKLNNYVPVEPYTGRLSESFLSAFQVVVLTNSTLEEQLHISDFCHANNICLVLANTKGLAGSVQSIDLGLQVSPKAIFSHLLFPQGNPGILTVAWDDEQGQHPHFQDGDWVIFSEVEGMTELNGSKPRPIRVRGEYSLEVGDTSSFSAYKFGGIITQVKMPQKYSFKSLRASMADPKIKTPDEGKLSRYRTLHMAFWTLQLFWREMQRLPKPRDQVSLSSLFLFHSKNSWLKRLSAPDLEDGLGTFSFLFCLQAASGKFTPLDQWLYFDAYECLPEDVHLAAENCAPCGSRYDGQVAVFGTDFQERLGKQKYFMVGAGAIGCELLKNFAMMGLAVGNSGSLTVTDMDTIEYSNLNRQFLFRPQDVSKLKSEVAATAVKFMNPNINVVAEQNQVGPETEHFYGDDFFLGLDGVWARDQFEGLFKITAENTHKFLKDPSFFDTQEGKALETLERVHCSLQEKPNSYGDCVIWARRLWERLFSHDIQQLLHNFPPEHKTSSGLPFWSGPKRCPRQLDFDCNNDTHKTFILAASCLFAQMHRLPFSDDIPAALRVLLDLHLPSFQPHQGVHIPITDQEMQKPRSAVDQVKLAKLKQELAALRQEMMKHSDFASDIMTSIHFEKDDDIHLDFITTAANLRAENYGIPPTDKLQAKRIAGRIVPAIATTTAVVAGLVCLELYKLVWGHSNLNSYRNSFLWLSEPLLNRFYPLSAPQSYKRQEKPSQSLQEAQREHSLVPRIILYGKTTLYDGSWEQSVREQQLSYRLTEVAQTVSREQRFLVLSIVCEDEEDDSDLPPVHVWLQPVSSKK